MRLRRFSDKTHYETLMAMGGQVYSRICPVDNGLMLAMTDGTESAHYYVLEFNEAETVEIFNLLEANHLSFEQAQPQEKCENIELIELVTTLHKVKAKIKKMREARKAKNKK